MSANDVSVLQGEVIDTSRLSHTEVWSSGGGGGGYVGPHGGHVHISAPQVHSKSVTNTDIYLRDANGKEHHVRVTKRDIPTRPGHQLALAYVKNGSDWELAVLHNLSTSKYWEFDCVRLSSGTGCLVDIAKLLMGLFGLLAVVAGLGVLASSQYRGEMLMVALSAFALGVAADSWIKSTVSFPQLMAVGKAKRALGLLPPVPTKPAGK